MKTFTITCSHSSVNSGRVFIFCVEADNGDDAEMQAAVLFEKATGQEASSVIIQMEA